MVQNTSHSPPFSLPLRYMLTGLIGFCLFAVDLLVQHARVSRGVPYVPATAALTHLLTLGVLLSFVMGAVYQLLTVAFLTPILGQRLAKWNYFAYVMGVIGLWWSMQHWTIVGLIWFGSLVSLSLWVYAGIIIASVCRSQVRGAMRQFVLAAHGYLSLAVAMAWLMIFSFWSGHFSQVFTRLLATHIVLAVGGFFLFLVVGFSYKLFPMFMLSHGFSTKRYHYTLGLFHLALWLFISYIWISARPLFATAGLVGLSAVAIELMDLRAIYQKRMRKRVDKPILFVFVTISMSLIGCFVFFVQAFGHGSTAGWQNLVSFYLLGVVVLTVMSYAYKIVPFLVWTYRYGSQVGKDRKKVPMMADLLNLNHSVWVYTPYLIGLAGLLIGVAAHVSLLALTACILLALAVLIFAAQMLYVLDVRKLPQELRQYGGKTAL